VAVCTAANTQFSPTIASDGAGGAIVTWADFRSGTDWDIYTQRVERFGQLGNPEPIISSASDVPNDQGGKVKVVWTPSYLDADPTYGIANYWVWRSVPPNVAQAALAQGGELVSDLRQAPRPGVRTFMVQRFGAQSYSWEYVASQVARGFPSYSCSDPYFVRHPVLQLSAVRDGTRSASGARARSAARTCCSPRSSPGSARSPGPPT